MKTIVTVVLASLIAFAPRASAADPLTDALQKGLIEEEANQNLDAAIKAYQDVLARAEEQRRVTATALFRLAECYRKQGKTNEATAEYRRLLRDYAEQSTLVNLSRQNLAGLGAAPAITSTTTAQPGDALTTDEEQQEIQRIRALIKNSPDLINTPNRTYAGVRGTLLHEAAHKGHLLVAEFLLASGADIHALDLSESTPLYQAAENGHKRMVELLLAKGAQPSPAAARQPLHRAVERNFKGVVQVLLAHKVDVNVKHPAQARPGRAPFPNEGMTALHIAIKEKNLEMAELLVSAGADPNITYEKPRMPNPLTRLSMFDGTALHFAVQSRNPAAVKMLLAKRGDPNAQSTVGLTTLHYVANREAQNETALEIAEMLLAAGAKVNALGNDEGELPGWTPLHMAVYHKLPHVLRLLLEKGADPNLALPSQSGNERTALNMAVTSGVPELAELLLNHKADANARDHNGDTPLVRAIRERNDRIVELLLSKGADPNAVDANGFPPLHVALGAQLRSATETQASGVAPGSLRTVSRNQPVAAGFGGVPQAVGGAAAPSAESSQDQIIVERLLKHKTDPNLRDKQSETALHVAAERRNQAAVELLLKYKADPNARTDFGITPLHKAVSVRHDALVDLLLAHNADVTAATKEGDTALHWAAGFGLTNIVAKLVHKGANINACGANGDTPLHRMIRTPNIPTPKSPTGEFLLKLGADILKSCDEQPTPLELAMLYNNRELADYFRKRHPKKLAVATFQGEVVKPAWLWEADKPATLSEAIAAVGHKDTADLTRITINRSDGTVVYRHDLIATREKLGPDVPLRHGDKIHVAVRED